MFWVVLNRGTGTLIVANDSYQFSNEANEGGGGGD